MEISVTLKVVISGISQRGVMFVMTHSYNASGSQCSMAYLKISSGPYAFSISLMASPISSSVATLILKRGLRAMSSLEGTFCRGFWGGIEVLFGSEAGDCSIYMLAEELH